MKTLNALASLLVVSCAIVTLAGCTQPPPGCQVSSSILYAAKYTQTAGDGDCAGIPGDQLGLSSYNPRNAAGDAPDLSKVTLGVRTTLLGSLAATAFDQGVVDSTEGSAPHAFGPFDSAVPNADDLCTATLLPAHQVLAEVPGDLNEDGAINALDLELAAGDPEDPDDDIPVQAAVDIQEEWSGVQVYVTAAAIGTQLKAHYKIIDNIAGCEAEYDVLGVFPAVFCGEDLPSGDPVEITSIDDDGADGVVTVVTSAAHNLAEGDLVEIAGVDDGAELSYDGIYSVATVDPDGVTFTTGEIDPFDGADPDPAGVAGTVQKLVTTPNPDLCVAEAQPDKGIPVGSGISPDFPTVCDETLLLCVLDAEGSAALPVLR